MPRFSRSTIFWLISLFALPTFCLVIGPLLRSLNSTTTVRSSSPDGRYQISLVDQHWSFIDRNFRLHLRDTKTSLASREVFFSPDEGRPIGTERFIWSPDSRYVLLVGRHFFVAEPALETTAGESIYLLLDTQSGEISCNASQYPDDHLITREQLEQCNLAEELVSE